MIELQSYSDREQMSRAVTDFSTAQIMKKIDSGKQFTLALSGGTSPVRFYELLATESIDWSMVKVFMVDERKVEQTHPDSNAGMIRKSFLAKTDIPEDNIIFPDTSIANPSECADEYGRRLKEAFGTSLPVFDLIVLGVGPDGHTASLFPGNNQALNESNIYISTKAPEPFKVADRLTMTMDLINNGRMRIFVVSGEGKQEMVQRIVTSDNSIPAGLTTPPCLIFTDSALP